MRQTGTYLLIALTTLASGCATIFNGHSQDVPLVIPPGTKVTNLSGAEVPVFYKYTLRDSGHFIRLDRKHDHYFRFSYNDRHVTAAFEGKFEPAWLFLDYMTFYLGYIIDGISGAWHSFDGIVVRFPSDTLERPYIEAFEPERRKKTGIVVLANAGYALPIGNRSDVPLLNFYTLGIGYQMTPRLLVLAEFSEGSKIDVMPRYTDHRTNGSYSAYLLGGRFKFHGDIYANAGMGIFDVKTDELTYFDTRRPSLSTDAVNKRMGALHIGLGASGEYGYAEIRHTVGLSRIPLSNGEIGQFETTSIGLGLNLHF